MGLLLAFFEFYVIPSKIRMDYETQVYEHLEKKRKEEITRSQLLTVRASSISIISSPSVIRS